MQYKYANTAYTSMNYLTFLLNNDLKKTFTKDYLLLSVK